MCRTGCKRRAPRCADPGSDCCCCRDSLQGCADFVRPVPVAAFSVPVIVVSGRHHERHKVSLGGAAVVGVRCVDEAVGDCRWDDGGASRVVADAGRHPWLREVVGPIVGRVVVAVVAAEPGRIVVPPPRFVEWCAAATIARRPVMSPFPPLLAELSVAADLLEYALVEFSAKPKSLEGAGGTADELLKVLICCPVPEVVAD